MDLLRRNLTGAGVLAASAGARAAQRGYTAIFGRDAAVCALGMHLSGDAALVRAAVRGLDLLARHQAPNGQIPKFVDPQRREVDFWYLGCIDATLWWLLALAWLDRLPAPGKRRSLRERHAAGGREGLRAEPVLAAYERYYRQFRKTYHVALQLESVIWKERPIPSVGAIVKAMFMAELSSALLTAGHDLARVELPLRVDAGRETETYTALNGATCTVKNGDMRISDAQGVISSIIGGPDRRTSITAGTRDLLFTVYAPAGIGEERVDSHLGEIERLVKVVAPEAVTELRETHAG